MEMVEKSFKPLWFKLTRKTFNCPQCGQRLRVPIRPGKTLRVSCVRCPAEVLMDFRVPFIEVFKWQSGKSLKQNLVDMHHRFWNMPLQHKIHVLLWILILALFIDSLLGIMMGLLHQATSSESLPALSPVIQKI